MKIRDWVRERSIISIPLRQAVICEDCKEVSASKSSRCPVCGSTAINGLPRLLSYSPSTGDRQFLQEIGVKVDE